MNEIYYKVCKEEDERLYSAVVLGSVVEYKINKWVLPNYNDGPLSVFKSYSASYGFYTLILSAFTDSKLTIFACKIIPSRKSSIFFWDASRRYLISISLNCLPKDTVLAEKVMLLKKVKVI